MLNTTTPPDYEAAEYNREGARTPQKDIGGPQDFQFNGSSAAVTPFNDTPSRGVTTGGDSGWSTKAGLTFNAPSGTQAATKQFGNDRVTALRDNNGKMTFTNAPNQGAMDKFIANTPMGVSGNVNADGTPFDREASNARIKKANDELHAARMADVHGGNAADYMPGGVSDGGDGQLEAEAGIEMRRGLRSRELRARKIAADMYGNKVAADAQNKDKALQTQLAIASMRNQPQATPDQSDQPAADPKLAVATLNAQVRERELAANAYEKERDRDVKLMIEKLKLASSLTGHPESEDMVQNLLATEQIPLYEGT
jgi:hypothetical protein